MSVHHKTAWASLIAAILVSLYYGFVLFSLKGNIALYNSEMMALARNVFGIALVFQSLMYFTNFMSKDEPEDKEISRQVSNRANQASLIFLVLAVAGCAFYLIYISDTRTLLLSPLVCAHLLVSILLAAWMIKYMAELFIYYRSFHDRSSSSDDAEI
ncbi:phosphatase [Paenibacillus sp. 1001270B_150601_E10]|uniref:phosphatase n=1 Tax=Paenibacillus sp. 1001270B_150601_E10 TaxID=2787079 RepID=UPI00189FFE5D|nr:phosphatase [Paenibacillus sp. 1001270B_150601_E10]